MLAIRSSRLVAIRFVHPANGVWCSSVASLPMLQLPSVRSVQCPSFAARYSKDAKAAVQYSQLNSNGPPLPSDPSSSTPSSSPSTPNVTECKKTESKERSTAPLGEVGLKVPSRDQVENFAFKSLVYLWDFSYYMFCLCRKLFEKYVVNNSTVQQNWKQLLKRMEDTRKEMKTK